MNNLIVVYLTLFKKYFSCIQPRFNIIFYEDTTDTALLTEVLLLTSL